MRKTALLIGCLSLLALAAGGLMTGCSTTRMLAEDELRLSENRVIITNSSTYNPASLTPYIKQKSNHYVFGKWHPGLYIYNWQNGKGMGWDRFCQKIGQAPVVFEEDMVNQSIKSMVDHLTYQGYYNSMIEARTQLKEKKAKAVAA